MQNHKNPIAATVQAIQGQPLPANWQEHCRSRKEAADLMYQERLENAWKRPNWSSKFNDDGAFANIAQHSRLSGSAGDKQKNDRADAVRWDELIGEK